MILLKYASKSAVFFVLTTVLGSFAVDAQAQVFPTSVKGWESVGKVTVPLSKQRALVTAPGDAILAHASDRRGRPDDLVSTAAYGDIELAFDYLLADGAEATLYLHDAYPIALADAKAGVYPPRQQVVRAPGIWQQLRIRFRAPRFDSQGHNIAPARLLRAELNGVVIHEDVQLPAPGASSGRAEAPLRLAVSRGGVAIKNFTADSLPEANPSGEWGGADPILVTAQVNTMLRSFMDVPGGSRVVHAISVGHPEQVHYTYDLDKGSLFQVWRGGFLDATPMWNSRGNGTSRVLGSPLYFGVPALTVGRLATTGEPWPADTTGTGYKPKGYAVDAADLPTFRYQVYGRQVEDAIRPLAKGDGFTRTVAVAGDTDGLYVRLAAAPAITDQGKGVFLIGDNAWYLRVEEAGKGKPFIRSQQDGQELLVPASAVIRYSIIF
ncbi:DUF1080 domain-containing protein [Parapedobacter soli]|uniref:DUF1080 domain-containing protein n=1 Tax=Parapedobacter soli TaxID=416955 RepID=UPI0021C7CD8F|nr:DUF1080 domain-containing protein [Parapedobacter soli]